jgi:hypothetical protein
MGAPVTCAEATVMTARDEVKRGNLSIDQMRPRTIGCAEVDGRNTHGLRSTPSIQGSVQGADHA